MQPWIIRLLRGDTGTARDRILSPAYASSKTERRLREATQGLKSDSHVSNELVNNLSERIS